MQTKTRKAYNRYIENVARINGQPFVLNQSMYQSSSSQQRLFKSQGDKADFLKKINHVLVEAQVGERVGIGVNRPVASRTNTDEKERESKSIGEMNPDEVRCEQTNSDVNISYALADSWAHAGNFPELFSGAVVEQMARDDLMIGWNGKVAARETDIEANPMLEDVNIGWLQKVVSRSPKSYMGYDSDSQPTDDTYKVGEGGQYKSYDALVFDMLSNLLDSWHQGSDDLVVLVGREVWVTQGMTLLSNSTLPTERNALSTWFAAQTLAGMPCVMPPFMPKREIVITSYSNLSIYHQIDTLRRTIIDNPKRDRIENFNSENKAYVVEDYGKFAGIRDGAILIPDGNGGWK